LEILVCNGYSINERGDGYNIEYKPFEKPELKKIDLCDEHFKKWCKLTYSLYEVQEK